MSSGKGIPAGWLGITELIKERLENENRIRNKGGNKFLQLEARLTDQASGKLMEDIVIYAIRTIKDKSEAEDFLNGYIENIKSHPAKYDLKQDAMDYAKNDIYLALNMHFASKQTHRLWNDVLGGPR